MDTANLAFLVLLIIKGVSGVDAGAEEVRELMEGDSIILETNCITKLQKDDEIEWKFESDVIATIMANNPLLKDTEDAKFKDKLQINAQTGDLTIRNTRTKHSGLYAVKIKNTASTTYRRFTVTVLDQVPTKVTVTVGESAILRHNIADIHIYDWIKWTFENGETPIAQINKQNSNNALYNETEKFKGRLRLDQSGSLTINNTTTTDSGLYKLKVEGTNINSKHRRFRVTVDEPAQSTGTIVVICVVVVSIVLILGVLLVVWIYRRRRGQQECMASEDKGNGVQEPLKGEQ